MGHDIDSAGIHIPNLHSCCTCVKSQAGNKGAKVLEATALWLEVFSVCWGNSGHCAEASGSGKLLLTTHFWLFTPNANLTQSPFQQLVMDTYTY